MTSILSRSNKRNDTGEIILTLFEFCNLTCNFCNQDHSSKDGIDSILSKVSVVNELVSKSSKMEHTIHVMGGEVFHDELPDEIFSTYSELVRLLRDIPKVTEVFFVSNLVFEKVDRVKKFLLDCDISLMTSYDPSGRFNKKTLPVFERNIDFFFENLISFNVIMTKPNMNKIKSGDTIFNKLVQNLPAYFDHYTPEKNSEKLMPSVEEMKEFFLFMVENYPNEYPFSTFGKQTSAKMSCMDTQTIMPSGTYGSCSILTGGYQKINFIKNKNEMEDSFISENECLTCEFFKQCSMGCYLTNHLTEKKTEECWMKDVHRRALRWI